MSNTKRVIITGGPGTGKTTLLKLLGEKGFPCHEEVSRRTIKEQLELGTDLVPWEDLVNFSYLVNKGQVEQYDSAEKDICNFYDRGVPDVLAYLRKDGVHEEKLENIAKEYPYHPTIFILPPWSEIYGTDNERREDLKAMKQIHAKLEEVYTDLGYIVKQVPKLSPEERLNFVLKELNL